MIFNINSGIISLDEFIYIPILRSLPIVWIWKYHKFLYCQIVKGKVPLITWHKLITSVDWHFSTCKIQYRSGNPLPKSRPLPLLYGNFLLGGVRLKDGCLSSCESGMEACVQPSWEIPRREAIHITLQEVFWIVSILWILIQIYDKFINKKKWAVCGNRTAHGLWSYASRFRCSLMLVATVWVSTSLL